MGGPRKQTYPYAMWGLGSARCGGEELIGENAAAVILAFRGDDLTVKSTIIACFDVVLLWLTFLLARGHFFPVWLWQLVQVRLSASYCLGLPWMCGMHSPPEANPALCKAICGQV